QTGGLESDVRRLRTHFTPERHGRPHQREGQIRVRARHAALLSQALPPHDPAAGASAGAARRVDQGRAAALERSAPAVGLYPQSAPVGNVSRGGAMINPAGGQKPPSFSRAPNNPTPRVVNTITSGRIKRSMALVLV